MGKRSLTPLGKITVIKTFMMSAFNHLFIMLPNPDSTLIEKINGIMFSFLLNKKPSKIKQATVIKQYGEEGLKMINIMAFIEALKSTWIRRLLITDTVQVKKNPPLFIFLHDQLPFFVGETGRNSGKFLQVSPGNPIFSPEIPVFLPEILRFCL